MSDPLAFNKVKARETGTPVTPAIVAETPKAGTTGKPNPVPPLTVASTYTKRLEDGFAVEPVSHVNSETPPYVVSSASVERPKAGLTKTKRNLKKQLHLKMAALDDGKQIPSLPSSHLDSEDAKVSVSCSVTPAGLSETSVCDDAQRDKANSTCVELNAPVTVKIEVPDDVCPSSSSFHELVEANVELLPSGATTDKISVSEDICPSSNETVSQSGAEVAGPTKWIIGDMLWARVSGHPWWPCMVAYDPSHTAFTRTLKRRQGSLVQYHVQFFGDEGERGWINEGSIIPFEGLEAFTKFCSEMIVLHKKERQNYVVPARRLKAWNIAVKSAEEAFPMTRVFRVHRFAFVYDQPVIADGSASASVIRFDNAQGSRKGVKRCRSSSAGASGDGQPRKRQRMSGEKSDASPVSPKPWCMSLNFRSSDQSKQDCSLSQDGFSPELGSPVFRSRAEGVKRSSRFVKPTNRIMEHLEEVQQRRRIKLRPYRKMTGFVGNASSEQTSETAAEVCCTNEPMSTPVNELSSKTSNHQNSSAEQTMETKPAEAMDTLRENSSFLEKMDSRALEMVSVSSAEKPVGPSELIAKTNTQTSPAPRPTDPTSTEASCALDAVVKVEVESSADATPINQELSTSSLLVNVQCGLPESSTLGHKQQLPGETFLSQEQLEDSCLTRKQSEESCSSHLSRKQSEESYLSWNQSEESYLSRKQSEESYLTWKQPEEFCLSHLNWKQPEESCLSNLSQKQSEESYLSRKQPEESCLSHSNMKQPEESCLSNLSQKPPEEFSLSLPVKLQEVCLLTQQQAQQETRLCHSKRSPQESRLCHMSHPESDETPLASATASALTQAQSDLGKVADVERVTPVRKRQRRTFNKSIDSVGSNLRSSRKQSTVQSPMMSKADGRVADGKVGLSLDLGLPLPEPESSCLLSTNQRLLPGRQKLTTAPQVLGNVGSLASQLTTEAKDTDGILVHSPRNSRLRDGSQYQLEFQRLNSVGPQKVEEVCHICEQSGDVLIDCQGPCFGSYHLSCLGLIVSPVGSFRCDECSTGNHPCFVCKHTSRDTVACSASKCGRFYHRDCVGKFPLCKVDSSTLTCPLHTCATCAAESGKNGRANKGLMYRCIRCPTAYHANDFCIAAGTVVIAGYNIICNSHLLSSKSPKKGMSHVNAASCFLCSKEGESLVLCSTCPAAFHLACIKVNQVSDPWQCKDCVVGKRPLYGEVVWAKVGNYRWWPAEVCHSKNLSVEIANKAPEGGHFVVRLFGVGLQFWLQPGRVFPFHERDWLTHEPVYRTMSDKFEKAVLEATEVCRLRLAAKDTKTNSEREKNDQKPPHYKHIKTNIPLGDVEIYKVAPGENPSCHCSPTMENPCGPDSDCINRLMMYECNALVCPAGDACRNQRFQKRDDADARPYRTEQRGWGLRSRADIKKGQFIAEYVGDLVGPEECNRRLEYAHQHNITNFYMLTLDKNRIIDAGPKGNYSRFMNHSCEPNCETQKWMVNGDIRVGLFALQDIPAGTELMFNYNLDCYGNQKTVCKCGSSICSGFLGVRPKTAAAVSVEKKSREAKLKKQLKEMKSKERHDVCYSCKKKGGELVICENSKCLKSYHLRCLKISNHTEGRFVCPWHKCESCGIDASKMCSMCPRSFCPLHLTGNIFEVSNGSLICSKHQDILGSCLQDSWNSSTNDRIRDGSNGVSSTSAPLDIQLSTKDGNVEKPPGRLQRKQSASHDKTPLAAKVMRRQAVVVVEQSPADGVLPTVPKKRGRPLKKVQNGQMEEEKTTIDSGSLVSKTQKGVSNHQSKGGDTSAGRNASSSSSSTGKRKRKASSAGDDEKTTVSASLVKSLRQNEDVLPVSFRNQATMKDPKNAKVGKLSSTNSPANSVAVSATDRSLELLKDSCVEPEGQFSPLVMEDSF